MWNVLIVIIIAVVIWMANPLFRSNVVPNSDKTEKKTIENAKQITNDTINQVNYARQMQKQEQEKLNN